MAHLLRPRLTFLSQLVPVALPLPDLLFNDLRAFRPRLRLTLPHDFQQRYLQPRPHAVEFGQNLRTHRRIEGCVERLIAEPLEHRRALGLVQEQHHIVEDAVGEVELVRLQ